jgi:hypothetical protein
MSTEPVRFPIRESPMSDKSPRQSMTKKTGKSIKEKRAAKRDAAGDTSIVKETPQGKKR